MRQRAASGGRRSPPARAVVEEVEEEVRIEVAGFATALCSLFCRRGPLEKDYYINFNI